MLSIDADAAFVFGAFKLDLTIDLSEDCVVVADADVCAGVKLGAALSNDDHAGFDDFAAEPLDAEAVGVAIATVFG